MWAELKFSRFWEFSLSVLGEFWGNFSNPISGPSIQAFRSGHSDLVIPIGGFCSPYLLTLFFPPSEL